MPDSIDTQDAISAALSFDWPKAIEINGKILSDCPDDIDCLNRLGKAYLEIGENKKAAQLFRKVLKINKYNPIALRNLTRANISSGNGSAAKVKFNSTSAKIVTSNSFTSFLEEPGKTKVINLVNVTGAKSLLPLNSADEVALLTKRHTVIVEDKNGCYLGALPDDLGHRLLILIKGGNKYAGFVKAVSKNSLTIFVKETLRAKKFHNTPSFPTSSLDYLSFVREDSTEETKTPSENEDSEGDEGVMTKVQSLHQDEVVEEN